MQANRFEPQRSITHIILGGLTLLLYMLITQFVPWGKQGDLLILASGYMSLFLICLSLLIGPLNLLRQRRNPVNIDLRRDVGIWAGITGCWHVLLVLRGLLLRGQFLLYFFRENGRGNYVPLLTLFGVSNDSALLAAILLFVLFALSNTLSLRRLKGRRWKQIQRLAYPLLLLAAIHTFGYQYLNLRGPVFVLCVIGLLVFVCIGQVWGIVLMRFRQGQRTMAGKISRKGSVE